MKTNSQINPFYISFFNSQGGDSSFFDNFEQLSSEVNFNNYDEDEDFQDQNIDDDDAKDDSDYDPKGEYNKDSEMVLFKCGCGRKFERKCNLKKHQEKCVQNIQPSERCKWHEDKEKQLIVCDVDNCDSSLHNVIELWEHFQNGKLAYLYLYIT